MISGLTGDLHTRTGNTARMDTHGFLRVAAASPDLRLANCPFNADRTLALMTRAEGQGVSLSSFPSVGSPVLNNSEFQMMV
jgi:hypothetical protein